LRSEKTVENASTSGRVGVLDRHSVSQELILLW